MKTTLDIPERLLAEAGELSGLRTKRAVVMSALDEFIASRRRQRLIEALGTVELTITPEDIRAGRDMNSDKLAALARWRDEAR